MNLQTKISIKEQKSRLKTLKKEIIFSKVIIKSYNNLQIQLLSVLKLERSKMKKC
jgi:hypothetical protein